MINAQPTRLAGDYVVPGEGDGIVIVDGVVDIGTDGRILAVGSRAELGPGPDAVNVGGLLMPGLVNAHAHTPMTLVRSVGDGLTLQRWLSEGVWPLEAKLTPDDARAGMALGSVEMLLAGVTTSCEMYLFEEALVDAIGETGARIVITPGIIAALSPGGDVEPRVGQISAFHRANHNPENRVHVGFGPHSIYDLTPEQCGAIAREARSVDALFHIHLEETQAEREQTIATYGKTATQLLADNGALEGRFLGAHGVWLDETDRRLLAEAEAAVAHCPQSNLKLGSGIARVAAMLTDGVSIGIGTDGPASNDDLDLWEDMRLGALLARGIAHDPGAIGAVKALDLATRQSAASLGLDDVGELRPGAWADLIRVDLATPAFTPLRPENLLTQLVFAGGARHVTDVWVAGAPIVANGEVTTVAIDELMADCHARCERLHS